MAPETWDVAADIGNLLSEISRKAGVSLGEVGPNFSVIRKSKLIFILDILLVRRTRRSGSRLLMDGDAPSILLFLELRRPKRISVGGRKRIPLLTPVSHTVPNGVKRNELTKSI